MTTVSRSADQVTPMSAALNALIDEAVGHQTIVGTSVLIAHGGEMTYSRLAGWADRERRVPVDSATVFRLASMTKPLVSAAVLALAERGQLDLDAPVSQYLPWFRPSWRGGQQPITLVQLLTHTSGLSCGFDEPAYGHPYAAAGVSDGLDLTPGTLEDNLRRLAGVELYSRPGSEWRYSLSTDVLGGVLEAVCKASLAQVVAETVTGPLEMQRTGFAPVERHHLATAYVDSGPDGGPAQRMPDLCLYDREGGRQVRYAPMRAFDGTAYLSGGVGMMGNAADYLRFLLAIGAGRFPSAKAAGAMVTDQVSGLETNQPQTGFGLGFSVLRAVTEDGRSPGTWGWGGLYGTTFWVDPSRKVAVIILTNTALEGMNGRFPARVAEIVCSELVGTEQTISNPPRKQELIG